MLHNKSELVLLHLCTALCKEREDVIKPAPIILTG